MASKERRERDRIPVVEELHGGVMLFQPMIVTEIGVYGMQIEMHTPLSVDALLDFRLPIDDQPVVFKGRVAYCRISDVDSNQISYRSGIEFVDMPDHAKQAVAKYMKRMKAAAAKT
jgi:hypothetical protein